MPILCKQEGLVGGSTQEEQAVAAHPGSSWWCGSRWMAGACPWLPGDASCQHWPGIHHTLLMAGRERREVVTAGLYNPSRSYTSESLAWNTFDGKAAGQEFGDFFLVGGGEVSLLQCLILY